MNTVENTTEKQTPCTLFLVYGDNEGAFQMFPATTDGNTLHTESPPRPKMWDGHAVTSAYAIIEGKTRRVWKDTDAFIDGLVTGTFPILEELSPVTVEGHHAREIRRQLEEAGAYMTTGPIPFKFLSQPQA